MAEIRMDLMYPAVNQEGFKQLYARCGPRLSLTQFTSARVIC